MPVNDPPTITLNREAEPEDYKSKSFILPLETFFIDGIPDNPIVDIIPSEDTLDVVTGQVDGSNFVVDIPDGYSEIVSISYGDTTLNPDLTYQFDIGRPL